MNQNQVVTNSEEQKASWIRVGDPAEITYFDIKQKINGERIKSRKIKR